MERANRIQKMRSGDIRGSTVTFELYKGVMRQLCENLSTPLFIGYF